MKGLFTLILAVGLLLPAAAFAQFNTSQSVDIKVEFDELFLRTYDGELAMEYTIDRRSWDRLQRHDITPTIDIYSSSSACDGQPVYQDVELYDRSELFILDHRDLRREERIEVRFSQRSYRGSQTTVRLQGSLSQTVEFSRERNSRQARSDRSRSSRDHSRSTRDHSRTERDHSRSERNHSRSERDRSRSQRSRSQTNCERSSRSRCEDRHDSSQIQAQIVDACSDNTSFDSDRQQCIQRAGHLSSADAVPVIEACGEQTSFGSDFGTCMQKAADFRSAPAPAIKACGEATSFGSDFTSCLESASSYQGDASPVIRSCGQSTSFSSSVPDCVADARI